MENKRTDYFRQYMSTYRKENKETVAKADKRWRDKNKEHRAKYMREYRARKKAEQEKNKEI
ncbi:hypothetical protein QTI82_14960 [Clostridium perfringens]|nr:hypothetical protein [Clostridium perfringens]